MPDKLPAATDAQTIVIEGELARVQKTVIERQVSTADLLSELAKLQPLGTGILPRGCIAFARAMNERGQPVMVYVIERPAGLHLIRFKNARSGVRQSDENITEYELSLPHTQWFVRHVGDAIASLHVSCTRKPIARLDDGLFTLPMPNVHNDGHGEVCLGNLVLPDGLPPGPRSERLVSEVLDSLWNTDLGFDLEPLGLESLAQWAEKSALDPDLGVTFNYRPHRAKTFRALLDSLLERK